jgi:hypothetical protein
MKKFLFLSTMIIAAATFTVNAQGEAKKEVEASGKIVTREVSVQSFDVLDVKGVFSVILSQDNKEAVKIESDENFQSLFEVKNEGSRLIISMKKNVNIKGKIKTKIYVSFNKLKAMKLETVGDVTSGESLTFDDLKIDNQSVGSVDLKLTATNLDVQNKSVGDIKLDGKAETARIRNKGVGSFEAAAFVVQKMDIENTGVGGAEVNAARELIVKDSFLGKVKNTGAASARKTNKVSI